MRVLIVADDLTGAADCAAPFRQAGLPPVVLTAPLQAIDQRFPVVSLSLHTREAAPANVRRAWQRHAASIVNLAQGALVYLKIDSTLRGSPALEVRLLCDLLGSPTAVIAPAFPKQGRQTIDGVHRVQGIPLAETEYAPARRRAHAGSTLPELFKAAMGPMPAHLPWTMLEEGVARSRRWIQERVAEACRVITVDAIHEGHLDTLTQAVLALEKRPLLVGSAGWAERLALALGNPLAGHSPWPGTLGVVGSLSAVAARQVRAAAESGATIVQLHTAADDPLRAITTDAWPLLLEALASGQHALIRTTPCAGHPPSRREGPRVLRAVAALVQAVLSAQAVSGLVIVGGETARSVFRALRTSGLALSGQVAAGVPYGRLLGGRFAGLPVVTKAGGFGEDTILRDSLNALQRWNDGMSWGP
jgi:uncharacterized protein YgbK (DUF1537 family)